MSGVQGEIGEVLVFSGGSEELAAPSRVVEAVGDLAVNVRRKGVGVRVAACLMALLPPPWGVELASAEPVISQDIKVICPTVSGGDTKVTFTNTTPSVLGLRAELLNASTSTQATTSMVNTAILASGETFTIIYPKKPTTPAGFNPEDKLLNLSQDIDIFPEARGTRNTEFKDIATVINCYNEDGTLMTPSTPSDINATEGYRIFGGNGLVTSHGNAADKGSLEGKPLNQPIVGGANTTSGSGYWAVARDGGIFSFGDAKFQGSTGAIKLNKPIVGMAPTPSGNGYWLVASDGGIFAYGDAAFKGSTGNIRLNQPIVGMAPTPTGEGYSLVASDGGIFSFGDAGFYGSTGNVKLNKPIVGMDSTPTNNGYWMVASDGGIFAYGDATFKGSTGGTPLQQPITGMSRTATGNGYRMVASDGGVFNFGDAGYYGSAVGSSTSAVGIDSTGPKN